MLYGEHFYNLTWNNGTTHEQLLSDITIPCVYLHAKESVADNGVYLCAASREQAERIVSKVYEEFRPIQDARYKSDFDQLVEKTIKH